MTTALYLEHLSDADLSLLASAASRPSIDDVLRDLHTDPGYLDALMQHQETFDMLFNGAENDAFLRASPFLVFAVLVHRTTNDLKNASFVQEWVAPGRRVPMFEVGALRDFSGDSLHRLFLAELLASYTHVASGSFLVRSRHGWRRRRYSELDPVRLLELIGNVPERERSTLYRRLGDLSLFLTGVFPDHADRLLPTLQRQRLARILASDDLGHPEPTDVRIGSGDLYMLEEVGRRSYRLAWKTADAIDSRGPAFLEDIADRFAHARRVLNFLTDRYMFPFREKWFPVH